MKERKTINHISGIILFIVLSTLVQSCYFDVIIEKEVDAGSEISFQSDIIPILSTSCTSCHDGTITLPDLGKADAYSSLLAGNYLSENDPGSSKLIQKINSGHPYTGAVASSELQKIIQWIESGANNN